MLPISRVKSCLYSCQKTIPLTRPQSLRYPCTQLRYATTDRAPSDDKISLDEKERHPMSKIMTLLGDKNGMNNARRVNSPPQPSNALSGQVLNMPRKPVDPSGPFSTYAGRTKAVENGDLTAAFRSLNSTLRNNSVAREYRTQKFYEKPSNKRVRLNRERHRKRFLSGVKRLVNLVKEQRKFL